MYELVDLHCINVIKHVLLLHLNKYAIVKLVKSHHPLNKFYLFIAVKWVMGLGLGQRKVIKKKRGPAQPEWPKQDWKILRRCMSRSPYKP
jgi:hypothetical protein